MTAFNRTNNIIRLFGPCIFLVLIGLFVAHPAQSQENDAASLMKRAQRELEQGKTASALKSWRLALEDDTFGPVATILLARHYLKLGCPEIAETYLIKRLKSGMDSVYKETALKLLVEAMSLQYDTRALKIIKSLVKKASGNEKPELIFKAAQLTHDIDDFETAEKLYRKLYFEYPASLAGLRAASRLADLVVSKKIPPPNYSDDLRLKRAAKLFVKGRFEKAATMYRIYLKKHPNDLGIKFKLARCMFKARHNQDAIGICKEILKEDKANKYRPETLHLLSLIFWRLDDDDKFLTCCKAIIREGPASFKKRTLYNLAAFHMERGQYSEAEELLKKLLGYKISASFEVDALWKMAWSRYLANKYSLAGATFEKVRAKTNNRRLKAAALYWKARSHQKSNGFNDAKGDFMELAKDAPLSYYGVQAARILKENGERFSPYDYIRTGFPSIELTESHLANPNIAAALKLNDVGLYEFAVMNLEELPRSLRNDHPVAFLMASTAYSAHEYHKARRVLYSVFGNYLTSPPKDAPPKFIELAFPCAHKDQTLKMARRHSVDPFLIWAVMRQESLYNSKAISPAGAVGLMQVMPRTAQKRSENKIESCDLTAMLLDPESNIGFGASILGDNLKSFDNEIVPAVASYNADIRKVRQWRAKRGQMDIDEFIETIPYSETRLYVKKVLEGYEAYTYLHKRKNLAGLW